MAFTYVKGSTADRNRLRLLIGDTDASRPLFEDAELDDLLSQEGDSINGSAAAACEILAIRYSRDFDFSADGASFSKSQVAKMYSERARLLRARDRGTTVIMPQRKDAYSDDIGADEADVGGKLDFDRGSLGT